ncbi:MAG: hypothetical protein HWN65_14450 [Candidatus Helarchaeota archaeon]|nr:hypothetical protein [Candidatus Helarchaeota archaeon]
MDFELKDGLVRSFMLLILGVVGVVFYIRDVNDPASLLVGIGLLMAGILFLRLTLARKLPSFQKTSKTGLIALIAMNSFLGSLVIFLSFSSPSQNDILLAILCWTFAGYALMHLIRKKRSQEKVNERYLQEKSLLEESTFG